MYCNQGNKLPKYILIKIFTYRSIPILIIILATLCTIKFQKHQSYLKFFIKLNAKSSYFIKTIKDHSQIFPEFLRIVSGNNFLGKKLYYLSSITRDVDSVPFFYYLNLGTCVFLMLI